MPKISKQPPGCRVYGVWLYANQQPVSGESVSVTPSRAGFYRGRYYSNATTQVKTDAQGNFSLYLPPSTIMGVYSIVLGDSTFHVEVPDSEAADLANLVEVNK